MRNLETLNGKKYNLKNRKTPILRLGDLLYRSQLETILETVKKFRFFCYNFYKAVMSLHESLSEQVLESISRHCPEALSTYLHCINRATSDRKVNFSRKLVEEEMSEGWTKFRNNLKKLAVEDLLEWHSTENGLTVILAEEDEDVWYE